MWYLIAINFEIWIGIRFKQTKGEVWAIENLFASHVLLLIVENAHLSQLILWGLIAGAEFAERVLTPAVKVAELIDNMAEVNADCKRWELEHAIVMLLIS